MPEFAKQLVECPCPFKDRILQCVATCRVNLTLNLFIRPCIVSNFGKRRISPTNSIDVTTLNSDQLPVHRAIKSRSVGHQQQRFDDPRRVIRSNRMLGLQHQVLAAIIRLEQKRLVSLERLEIKCVVVSRCKHQC